MPLQVSKSFFKNINLSIWNIDESEDYFLSQINLTENCKKRLELIKSPQKRKQFLSVRNLIKLLTDKNCFLFWGDLINSSLFLQFSVKLI